MLDLLKILQDHLYRIIGALVILLIGLTLGLIAKKVLRKALHEIELDKAIKRLGKDYSLEKRLSSLAAYSIYFFTFVVFLTQLGLASFLLYLLAAVFLLLLSLTLFLGAKDFIPNLAGRWLAHQKGCQVGKKIKVDNLEGKIQRLGLLEMEIQTRKGDRIHLPNSLLVKSKIWLKP